MKVSHSKTDQCGDGASTYHQKSATDLCPVGLVVLALRHFADQQSLLPKVGYHSLLRFTKAVARFGAFDSPKSWSPQGCRRGGATSLFAAGADALAVQKHGRWRSDIFLRYNQPSVESAAGLSDRMGRHLTLQ